MAEITVYVHLLYLKRGRPLILPVQFLRCAQSLPQFVWLLRHSRALVRRGRITQTGALNA